MLKNHCDQFFQVHFFFSFSLWRIIHVLPKMSSLHIKEFLVNILALHSHRKSCRVQISTSLSLSLSLSLSVALFMDSLSLFYLDLHFILKYEVA